MIDGERFDLKTPLGNSKNTLSGMVKGKSKQASNFVFNTSMTKLDQEEIERQISSIYSSKFFHFVDKIILYADDEVYKVYERNK